MLLAEEFLLLGLDPVEGIVINNARRELLVGLAGALVAELALAGQDRTSVVARTEGRKPLARARRSRSASSRRTSLRSTR
jgi:Golgi phosphoprotein 3 (GPP34)